MTPVRTLMALLTLGAACAGYVYLQQAPPPGEPYYSRPSGPTLYDWNHSRAKADTSRVPTKDLVYRVRERTRSALDDFASQHGGDSNAPGEDAYVRLTQVAHAVVRSSSDSDQGWNRDLNVQEKSSRGRIAGLDELQRTAFDPAVEEEVVMDSPVIRDNDSQIATKPPIPPITQTDVSVVAEKSETTLKNAQSGRDGQSSLPSTDEQPKEEIPVSRVSRSGKKQTVKNAVKERANVGAPQWKVVGKTTEGQPMHSMHLGENGTRTLVIAGLNGTDRTAVRWLELLADELARQPDALKDNEVVFFRAGNPDGLLRNVSNNSRDVPLNRNFPSRRYRSTSDMPAFAVPAGEVETRVMLDTLYTFRPRRVIHLMSTTGRSQVMYNKLAGRLATEFERSSKVALFPLDAEQLPGSIEDFADGTLEAAVLSMRLSIGNDWQQAWQTLQPHVLAAVIGQSPDDEDSTFDPDRSPVPTANIEPVSRRPYRRGYEELPPPPN